MARGGVVKVYQRKDGQFDYRVIGGNGEEMAGSLQGYRDAPDAIRGYTALERLIVEHRPAIEVVDNYRGPDG